MKTLLRIGLSVMAAVFVVLSMISWFHHNETQSNSLLIAALVCSVCNIEMRMKKS